MLLTEGTKWPQVRRRMVGVVVGRRRRNGVRGQGIAGVLRASDLLKSMRGVAAEVYKGSGRDKGHRR